MIPGITNLPARSTISALPGAFNCEAGPTQVIRPLSTISAAEVTGARPDPSITVKFFRTLTSPWRARENHTPSAAARTLRDGITVQQTYHSSIQECKAGDDRFKSGMRL